MGKYIGLLGAFLASSFAGIFAISYSIPEALVFAVFLIILTIWFGFYREESLKEEKLTPGKVAKLLALSFLELFVVFSFVNVVMFPEFYISDILRVYYFVRVFSLMIIYWFVYFVIKMFTEIES